MFSFFNFSCFDQTPVVWFNVLKHFIKLSVPAAKPILYYQRESNNFIFLLAVFYYSCSWCEFSVKSMTLNNFRFDFLLMSAKGFEIGIAKSFIWLEWWCKCSQCLAHSHFLCVDNTSMHVAPLLLKWNMRVTYTLPTVFMHR